MQILEQIQTAAAVNLREVESDMHLLFILETYQLLLDLGIVQKSKFVLPNGVALRFARSLVEIIVVAKTVLVQQLINHFAAITAKDLIIRLDLGVGTFFSTVITGN